MRRSDLAITEAAEMDAIIERCDCVRLAFADGTHPYIIPVSFGYRREDGTPIFYFHSAAEGRKVDLARSLAYAAFEVDGKRVVHQNEKPCDFSQGYECVLGEGTLSEITNADEKAAALNCIMAHYSPRGDWDFPEAVMAKTVLFRLTAQEMTARAHA